MSPVKTSSHVMPVTAPATVRHAAWYCLQHYTKSQSRLGISYHSWSAGTFYRKTARMDAPKWVQGHSTDVYKW